MSAYMLFVKAWWGSENCYHYQAKNSASQKQREPKQRKLNIALQARIAGITGTLQNVCQGLLKNTHVNDMTYTLCMAKFDRRKLR